MEARMMRVLASYMWSTSHSRGAQVPVIWLQVNVAKHGRPDLNSSAVRELLRGGDLRFGESYGFFFG